MQRYFYNEMLANEQFIISCKQSYSGIKMPIPMKAPVILHVMS